VDNGTDVVLIGRGEMVVLEGSVNVFGYQAGAQGKTKPISIASDPMYPVAIHINDYVEVQVPLIASRCARLQLRSRGAKQSALRVANSEETGRSIFRLPDEWTASVLNIVESIQNSVQFSMAREPPVICVCGAKNSGKSLFSRFLVNSLLNNHALVDYLDIGTLM